MPDSRPPQSTVRSRPSSALRNVLIGVAVALALAAWGIFSRIEARAELVRQAAAAAIPTVGVVSPSHGKPSEELSLPGTVQAYYEAPIYARTSGYLKRWLVDIGTRVKSGELIAEIDTPEVDQQLNQARADLATAQANEALSATTNERWKGLLASDSVSRQDADDKAGDYAAKKALTASALANVRRLQELESFKRVLAPFDGVVTVRNTDIGALINAGAGGTPGSELFRVADTHKLRIYVQVPQPYAGAMRPGLAAELEVADHPGRRFHSQVARTADAIDPTTRTLLTQLEFDNAGGELYPGAFSEVHFKIPTRDDTVRLPANALLFRSAGLQVAVVGDDGHVKLHDVVMGRDFGTEVEILSGIAESDRVVLNPPDSLGDGQQVRVAAAPAAPQAAGAPVQAKP
ncbi:MAG: efflux RND transporter periplasmic adaptor subunit [Nevskia sp.]|nr:efflux RND transporter periplasmic adaptor subunit [Nevskia sp.]